jgi:hypothetical protein
LAKIVGFSSVCKSGSRPHKQRHRSQLLLEVLEDRCVPTTITPTTFADGVSGSGSLRAAVLQFNADAGTDDDIIQLLAGTYSLTIRNTGGRHETAGLEGDLNITRPSHRWIIQGAGSSGENATIIDAGQLQDRVFQIVTPGTQVVFRDLIIQGGLAQDDGSNGVPAGTTDSLGGGLLNNGGNVTLADVVVRNNRARGGDAASYGAAGHNARGGGVDSAGGVLSISAVTFANNQSIGGRGGDYYYISLGGDGGSAGGAGLYASGGTLDISNSMIASNRATGGRGGDGYYTCTPSGYCYGVPGGTGGAAQGGGLYMNGGALTISTSNIAANEAIGGPGGIAGGNGANQGAGLYNRATLMVTNCTLSSNNGGGIYNANGALTVTNGTLSNNNGDGIYNANGVLTVTNSTLSGNGTGIINESGTVTVSNSTLSRNSAGYGGNGGGINNWGTLTVTNSTLSGNSATYGGGIYNRGTLTVSNSTLSGNIASIGGGIYNYIASSGFSPLLRNTLIAGNFAGATRSDVFGLLNPSGSYNLIGVGSGMTGLRNGVNGNLVGTAAAPIDPRLGPLQDNGGPTQTMALLPGSPAVDAGNNGYATPFDQRGPGFPRVLYGAIDIGAFELARGPLLTVTSTLDVHREGMLNLREAVNQANTDAGRGQGDTIVFAASLGNATITLGAGPLELSGVSATATETIDGGGRITVSGNDASRVFQIDAGVQAELYSLTISHGWVMADGGGIANYGTLVITACTLAGNAAGTNGGGVSNTGTLTLSRSTLAGNAAGADGGGIASVGALTVSNSTLSGNSAARNGGGLWTALAANSGTLTNVTISANWANTSGLDGYGGGVLVDPASAVLPVLHDTLIAGNLRGPAGTSRDDMNGAVDPGGDYNLIGDGTGLTGLSDGVNGNLVGTASAPIDPVLGPLQDNGGPTPTMALLPGSPALDAGNNAYSTAVDQRGLPRVRNGRIDIGAFELAPALLTVTSTADVHTDGLLTLREALDEANGEAGRGQADTITFAASLGNATITLSAGQLELYAASTTATVTLVGGGRLTVSGNDASRVFQIDPGVRAELDGLTITHGHDTDGYGGGIVNFGTLTVRNCGLIRNDGNGISNFGTLTVRNSTLSGNAAVVGGGIYNYGTLLVTGSTLTGNSAITTVGEPSGYGGGIYNRYGTLTISNSTLSGNTALVGGGIYNNATLTVVNSTLTGNTCGINGYGGGISNNGTQPVTLTNVTLAANFAGSVGGLLVASGSPLLHNTLIARNGIDVYGALDSSGDNNLIGNGSYMSGLSDGVNGNLVGSLGRPIDPLLGPLQDNGGPTQTHALLSGSPAIDAGNNAYATDWDQRGEGFPRIVNGIIDIGAFEVQAAGPAPRNHSLVHRLFPIGLPLNPPIAAPIKTILRSDEPQLSLLPPQPLVEAPTPSHDHAGGSSVPRIAQRVTDAVFAAETLEPQWRELMLPQLRKKEDLI